MSFLTFKQAKNISDDFIFLCDEFGSLRDARMNMHGVVSGFEFSIQTIGRKEEKKHLKVDFGGGSSMATIAADNWLRISNSADHLSERFSKKTLLIEGLSLLLTSLFVVDGIVDRRKINLGGAWNQQYEPVDAQSGISVEDERLTSGDEIADFWTAFDNLSENDMRRFRSSLHLFWQARTSFARGYISEAVTNAVSALENLYTLPDHTGFIKIADTRVLIDPQRINADGSVAGKRLAYNSVFTQNSSDTNAVKIVDEIDPYDVRSKHLHGGVIIIDKPQDHPNTGRLLWNTRIRMLEILNICVSNQ